MILNILIATVVDRRKLFNPLLTEFNRQIKSAGLQGQVSVIYKEDRKEMSIGRKRQLLLEESNAEYIVFFDSDDRPRPHYVTSIVEALELKPDCVGMLIDMTTNGYDYVRNVTHFNPVRRDLALQAGFKDIRFGEDKDYSDRVTPLCKTEVFIEVPVFDYLFSSKEPFKQKYGIK